MRRRRRRRFYGKRTVLRVRRCLVPGEADQDQVSVEVSYTGVARVDGTDGEAASADLLEQSMDAMTLAIHDGSFLTKLQASDPAFSAVAVDVDATQAAIEAASYRSSS